MEGSAKLHPLPEPGTAKFPGRHGEALVALLETVDTVIEGVCGPS